MNYYEPKYLAGVLKKLMPLRLFFRTRFFKDTLTFPTETVSFEYQGDNRKLAPYANRALGSRNVSRTGYKLMTFHAPLVAPSRIITPDTLATKLIGEQSYNSGITPDERAEMLAINDMVELQDQIYRREEYMCARLKQDGQIAIDDDGISEVINYGFKNIEDTESSEKWGENYDILGKLQSKADYLREKGINADMLIMGSDAANAFINNKKIQKLLDLRQVDIGAIKPEELEDGVNYLGRIAMPGLFVNIYEYREYYEDDNGAIRPLIDPGTVIMQSSREQDMMLYGSVTFIDDTNEYVSTMAEYVPYTVIEKDPPMKKLIVASRPLPMIRDIESWYVMKNVI